MMTLLSFFKGPYGRLALSFLSLELKADPFVGTPNDMTGLTNSVTGDSERELVWKPERRTHFDGSPRNRDVTNKARDSAAAEFNGSGLIHPMTWRSGQFVHLRQLILIAPSKFRRNKLGQC